MILLRLRRFGSSDWTEVMLDGELESEAANLLVSRTLGVGLHVQEHRSEGWEDYVD